MPVFDNVLCTTQTMAKEVVRGTQDLALCYNCGFLFNCKFESKKVIYGKDYHAERGKSHYFSTHIKDVAQWLNEEVSLKNKAVLEVACGDGEFLNEVLQYQPKRCIGVDPSSTEIQSEHIRIFSALFNEQFLTAHPEKTDILINRHMVEHLEYPLQMFKVFSQAVDIGNYMYLETPRLDWILKNHVFYDFPYEHCSYFSDSLMARMLLAAGFEIQSEKHTYAGQYFSILAQKTTEPRPLNTVDIKDIQITLQHLEETKKLLKASEERLVSELSFGSKNNAFYLWGGSAKGVMCCNLLNTPVQACIDKNPLKQGEYIPGTGTPVIAPTEICIEEAETILVENDVYLDEITAEAHQIEPRIRVLSINQLLGIGSDPE